MLHGLLYVRSLGFVTKLTSVELHLSETSKFIKRVSYQSASRDGTI